MPQSLANSSPISSSAGSPAADRTVSAIAPQSPDALAFR